MNYYNKLSQKGSAAMENIIASWESEIAKTLNHLRKCLAGKGARQSQARVADNLIFSKMLVDLTDLELHLLKHIQSVPTTEQLYYDDLRPKLCQGFNGCLAFLHSDLKINDIHIKVDLPNRMLILVLIMNMNIEEMIRSGTVSLPNKGQCHSA
jgi:uncharacterized protein YbcI